MPSLSIKYSFRRGSSYLRVIFVRNQQSEHDSNGHMISGRRKIKIDRESEIQMKDGLIMLISNDQMSGAGF